jgi:hypothetical protein
MPSTLLDVFLSMCVWPMSLENSGCVVIYFHLPFAFKPSTLKAQIEAANPSKKRTER